MQMKLPKLSQRPQPVLPRTLALFALTCAAGAIALPTFVTAPHTAMARATMARAALADELPAADTIIDKSIEASGGRAALEKIKTRTIEGTLSLPAQKIEGKVLTKMANNSMLTNVDLAAAGTIVRGYNGESKIGWEKNDMTGVRLLKDDELEEMRQQSDPSSEINWRNNFKDAKTISAEKANGMDCYKIELTNKRTGKKESRFYSKETGLLEQMQSTVESPQGTFPLTVTMSDYRDMAGLKVPFKTTQKVSLGGMEQVIEIGVTDVKVNEEIPADTFALPDDVKALVAKQKSGGADKKEDAMPKAGK